MDAAKKYEYIKTLGEGSYGHVWLCRDRERDCLVAIKKFKDANKDSQAYHLAMREIKLLRAASHEHVVSVIEAFRSQSSGNVYLVMEYADSCLNQELKKHRQGVPPEAVERMSWQLASALQYLHCKKVMHRDLKPANILLTAAGDVKLCDFGFARDLPTQPGDLSSYVTTRWYRAPEVVVGADYGAAVDIWAFGCLFAELLNGQPLFPGNSNMDQLALIVNCFGHLPNRLLAKALTNPHLVGVQLRTGNPRNWAVALQQRFATYGEDAVSMLLACLNPDPLKRASADEVMRMPYFASYRKRLAAQSPKASLASPTAAAVLGATSTPAEQPQTPQQPAQPAAAHPASTEGATAAPPLVQHQQHPAIVPAPSSTQQKEASPAAAAVVASVLAAPGTASAPAAFAPAVPAVAPAPAAAHVAPAATPAAAMPQPAPAEGQTRVLQHEPQELEPAPVHPAQRAALGATAVRSTTEDGTAQSAAQSVLRPPGVTLAPARDQKRMSEANISTSGGGAAAAVVKAPGISTSGTSAAMPVRFSRVSLNHMVVTPSTSDNGGVPAPPPVLPAPVPAVPAALPVVVPGLTGTISGRRRSTQNGTTRLRMSTTTEGADATAHDDDEDSSAEPLPELNWSSLRPVGRGPMPPSRLSGSGVYSGATPTSSEQEYNEAAGSKSNPGHGPSNLGRHNSQRMPSEQDLPPAPPPVPVHVVPDAKGQAAAVAGLASRPFSHLTLAVADSQHPSGGGSAGSSAAASPSTTPTAGAVTTRRTTIADGPSSILRTMLRTLSNRRASASNTYQNGEQVPPSATVAPVSMSNTGQNSTTSSAGVSPFVPTRPSSNNFILGGPFGAFARMRDSSDGRNNLSQPAAAVISEDMAGNRTMGMISDPASAGARNASPPRLPVIAQRPGGHHPPNGTVHGQQAGGPGYAPGYGSAAVSPSRRASLNQAQLRMSENGIVTNLKGAMKGGLHKA